MRYATVTITPESGAFQPADGAVADDPAVVRESIDQLESLDDGTCVMLSRVRGDLSRAADILDGQSDVLGYDIATDGDSRVGQQHGYIYVHFRPTETVAELLAAVEETEAVLKTPLEYRDNGGVRVTLIGDDETIQRTVEAVPNTVRISLEGTGDYRPSTGRLLSVLTPRQREILEAAVEAGYYEVPRQATHEDIAETVDVSAGTVGEHLRKVEGKLLSSLVE
ncbi:HTH-10 family transcription regulator [Natronomonas pharaonis DSM 2160]|uniref:HTH-10 family transcription regulator n=1 Tax=Natronomonas pharaonis (strain ATCC 35678 / DSM 2160 / CIP 103997 / JCM 8858 / NBRC 14720 / NCIMB 2260 / Gabara) TaxID=348780 RepID=A0A1U7EYK3_NATPD|nr:helix-turn-helix domain-containing protein [Natronomonas pharaonis]CAI50309.1 HTH-10 family transcription regulator [Natronomonas pharaonis DSM 2160]